MKSQNKVLTLCALSVIAAACAEVNLPKSCEYQVDCGEGEICSDNICLPDPCLDGVISADESDVDCGHVCLNKCDVNQKCVVDADCRYNTCKDGVCIDPEEGCDVAEPGELLITEILNNVSTGKNFEAYGVESVQTEFFEIYNKSNKKIALGPISIRCTRTDDGSNKELFFSMNGCIEPKNAAIVSNAAISGLPEGVVNIRTIADSGALTNTASYQCELIQKKFDDHGSADYSTLHSVMMDSQAKAGVSEALDPLEYASSARSLVLHTDVSISDKFPSGTKHSPGYCANGALYKNDCDTLCSNGEKDPGESDVDCGGPLCGPCAVEQACVEDSDCLSDSCVENVCSFRSCTITGCPVGLTCDAVSGECHSCTDSVKNGDETDVDCGGLVCGRCQERMNCATNNDCESFKCEDGSCVGGKIECLTPEKGDLVISEILNNASSTGTMASFVADTEQKQVEFIELVNLSDKYLSLDGLIIQFKRLNGTDGSLKIELNSCIAPNQASVISGSSIAGLPEDVSNVIVDSLTKKNLNNKAIYEISLLEGENVLQIMHDGDVPSAGVSHVLIDLAYSSEDVTLVKHNSLNPDLKHSPGYCTNGALFANKCEIVCENGRIDAGETDIDCGGNCAKCGTGKSCVNNDDCESGSCENAICAGPKCEDDTVCPNGWCNTETGACESCSDGVKNGTETDIDCGGNECGACDAGKVCQINIDCLSYDCKALVCVGDPVESFKADELIINEVMGSPRPSQFFSTQPETNQCEFIELVSIATERRNLNGWSIAFKKSDSDGNATEIPLFNILDPKHGVVIHNCSALPLPANMREQVYNKTAEIFANTSDFDIWLTNGTDNSDVIVRKGLSANGQSQTRQKDLDVTSDLVFHDSVSKRNHNSPGYCANGGLFTDNCVTTCENTQLDLGESDVDCGGLVCDPCEIGKTCSQENDCESGYCSDEGLCANAPCTRNSQCEENWTCDVESGKCISCMDEIRNGSETDVDCGGSCSTCEEGKSCLKHTDCITGFCEDNICKTTTAVFADPEDLVVNEILDSGTASPKFLLNNNVAACEFIEIANPTDKDLNLLGLQLVLTGTNNKGEEQKPVPIELSGILKSKNLLVVHNCETLPLPEDAVSFFVPISKMITGTWKYKVEIVSETKTSTQIDALAIGGIVNSSYNREPDMSIDGEMKKTVDIAGYAAFATPGYCANGGLYSEGCKSQCENGRKDGDESDIDCGGSACSACSNDKYCTQHSDCLSGQCNGGRCAGEIPVEASLNDLVINEVMGSPKSGGKFAIQTETDQSEFIEIVNTTSNLLRVDGIMLKLAKGDSIVETADKTIALKGIIPENGVLVVSDKEIPMPSDGVNMSGSNPQMTNGSAYAIWLSKGSENGGLVKRMALGSGNGKSQNRSVDLGGSEALVWHTEVNGSLLNSPGYCANGNKFSDGCN